MGLPIIFNLVPMEMITGNRNKLGPIALQRAEKSIGLRFSQDEILVIGDTPKDVACAHAFGAKCVAVATGNFSEEELVACGADRTVPDLRGVLTLKLLVTSDLVRSPGHLFKTLF
jgi:phosphoglycolate phosphatase-like HAD superfamily hydrolase